jgi:hypothetical protein
MSATTPSPPAPRRKPGRPPGPNPKRRRDRLAQAVDVLAALARLPPTPAVAELAAAVGWPAAKLAGVLDALGRSGLIERWPDTDDPGRVRVMLSARALARLGLVLAPRGDRWNPDRPPVAGERRRGSPPAFDHPAAVATIAGAIGLVHRDGS